jgi:hypothetical protein
MIGRQIGSRGTRWVRQQADEIVRIQSIDEPLAGTNSDLRRRRLEAVLIDRHDKPPPSRSGPRGRVWCRGGPSDSSSRSAVDLALDRHDTPPPLVYPDLEIVRGQICKWIAVFVDHADVDRDEINAAFDGPLDLREDSKLRDRNQSGSAGAQEMSSQEGPYVMSRC